LRMGLVDGLTSCHALLEDERRAIYESVVGQPANKILAVVEYRPQLQIVRHIVSSHREEYRREPAAGSRAVILEALRSRSSQIIEFRGERDGAARQEIR